MKMSSWTCRSKRITEKKKKNELYEVLWEVRGK